MENQQAIDILKGHIVMYSGLPFSEARDLDMQALAKAIEVLKQQDKDLAQKEKNGWNELAKLLDEDFQVIVGKVPDGFFVEVSKQVAVDAFIEDVVTRETLETAINVLWQRYLKDEN